MARILTLILKSTGSLLMQVEFSATLGPKLQPDDCVIYRDVGHAQPLGEVHDARFARFGNQIGDGFHVVFCYLIGVFTAGLGQVFRLALGIAATTWPVRQFFFCGGHFLDPARNQKRA